MNKKTPLQKVLRAVAVDQGTDYDAEAVLQISLLFDYPRNICTRSGLNLNLGW